MSHLPVLGAGRFSGCSTKKPWTVGSDKTLSEDTDQINFVMATQL